MDLPQLFASRKAALEQQQRGSGSTRAMAARAAAAGHPISHTQLGQYARRCDTIPSEQTRLAIAAALGVDEPEVLAAAWKSVTSESPEGAASQHAQAFIRMTEGRTDDEIRLTLSAVEVTLRAMAASREQALREASEAGDPDR